MKLYIGELFTFIITFATVWLVTLFIALPIGVNREDKPLAGQDAGAPQNPNLKKKFAYSALAAFIISLGIFIYVEVLS